MPGKIFINETADKQKVELTTGADGVTGGYYDPDGVWHDFGGGGGGLGPIVHFKVTYGGLSTDPSVNATGYYCDNIIVNNHCYTSLEIEQTIAKDEYVEFDALSVAYPDSGTLYFPVPNNFSIILVGLYGANYNFTSLTNAEWSDDQATYLVIDPTKDAYVECTITYTNDD